MKTALLAFFFLFAISTTLPSASADAVIDTDGDIVENGRAYYILLQTGHGLEVAKLPNDTDPVSVIQSATSANCWPLKLYTHDPIIYLTTEYHLNIQFVGNDYGVWEVLNDTVKIYKELSKTGPFKIATDSQSLYRILYTPDSDTSKPLQVSPDDRHLNLVNGTLLTVKSQKATGSSSRMSIM